MSSAMVSLGIWNARYFARGQKKTTMFQLSGFCYFILNTYPQTPVKTHLEPLYRPLKYIL